MAAFVATVVDPLPSLPAVRLALAARCQGLDALTAGDPVGGLGPGLLRRLRRAAALWLRWRPAGAPDPAGELLRRADAAPGIELGELVRGFAVDARQLARRTRAQQPGRLDAAHRRAVRHQAAILAAWPAWLKRGPGDRLVLDPGQRFLQWHAPASTVELTDRDGRYAYVPLDASRLALDGDRTRGP